MRSKSHCTARSFPGITEDENIITSSGLSVVSLDSPVTIRISAAYRSHCAPVQQIVTSLSGSFAASSIVIIVPGFGRTYQSLIAISI